MRKQHIVVLFSFVLIASCTKDSSAPVDLGLDYFPVNIGNYVEYQVDSTYLDEPFGAQPVSGSYQLREVLTEAFVDAQGRPSQRIERFVLDSIGNWLIRDVWYQHRSSTRAERVEENQRKVRMVFKPGTDKYWNLNAYNSYVSPITGVSELEMTYTAIDEPAVVNGFSFDSTIVVNTTYQDNLVNSIEEKERFAKHVGLVEKEWIEQNSQFDKPSGIWLTKGWHVTYKLIGYGTL